MVEVNCLLHENGQIGVVVDCHLVICGQLFGETDAGAQLHKNLLDDSVPFGEVLATHVELWALVSRNLVCPLLCALAGHAGLRFDLRGMKLVGREQGPVTGEDEQVSGMGSGDGSGASTELGSYPVEQMNPWFIVLRQCADLSVSKYPLQHGMSLDAGQNRASY